MISVTDILLIHKFVTMDFGGADGIRDKSMLLSAIARPFQTFDGRELYSSPVSKVAAITESLIVNHPFVDGNKRVGMVVMLALLTEFGISINATESDLYSNH